MSGVHPALYLYIPGEMQLEREDCVQQKQQAVGDGKQEGSTTTIVPHMLWIDVKREK
jgi:hypothetical protein